MSEQKPMVSCSVFIVALALQFLIIVLATWLICKCLNHEYRWLYAVTTNVLVIILNMFLKGLKTRN